MKYVIVSTQVPIVPCPASHASRSTCLAFRASPAGPVLFPTRAPANAVQLPQRAIAPVGQRPRLAAPAIQRNEPVRQRGMSGARHRHLGDNAPVQFDPL